jgi:hypothetical protein
MLVYVYLDSGYATTMPVPTRGHYYDSMKHRSAAHDKGLFFTGVTHLPGTVAILGMRTHNTQRSHIILQSETQIPLSIICGGA